MISYLGVAYKQTSFAFVRGATVSERFRPDEGLCTSTDAGAQLKCNNSIVYQALYAKKEVFL